MKALKRSTVSYRRGRDSVSITPTDDNLFTVVTDAFDEHSIYNMDSVEVVKYVLKITKSGYAEV